MRRNEILDHLKAHDKDLRDLGVARTAVFGSVARGEDRADSDVDILVEFSRPIGMIQFARVQLYLEELIGRTVDLVTPDALRPEMRDEILAEAVYAS